MSDTTTKLPAKCANTFIHGLESVEDANYANEPGTFTLVVDLGLNFNSQPSVQLTQKLIHDDEGTVLDTGDHQFSYRWLDSERYSKFEIVATSTRLNYPPSVSYFVAGNTGYFSRLAYCRSR